MEKKAIENGITNKMYQNLKILFVILKK